MQTVRHLLKPNKVKDYHDHDGDDYDHDHDDHVHRVSEFLVFLVTYGRIHLLT